jgi:predicted nucleic acid-binding protein
MKPMPGNKLCFIDSNVWLYAFTADNTPKNEIAQMLIKASQPVISGQVINEVCVNLIRRAKFPEAKIGELIETFYQKYDVVEMSKGMLLSASQLRQEHAFSYWDSLIVAAALASEAQTLYSEDMQHEQVIRKTLKIINPFKT